MNLSIDDILLGSILYFLFSIFFIIKTPSSIKTIFIYQIITLFSLLVFTHLYSYYNYYSFPGLGDDSLAYDIWAKYLSEQFRMGVFDLSFDNIYDMSLAQYKLTNSTHMISYVPFGFVIPHSIIYTIFGYKPFVAKIFNVLVFVITTRQFYYFLSSMIGNKKIVKKVLFLFAFFPPLMISSVSFIKEPLFIFGYLNLIIFFYKRDYIKSIPYLTLTVLIRPYTPLLFIIFFLIYNNKELLKNFGKGVITALSGILFFSLFTFQKFNLMSFANNTTFAININPLNPNEIIYSKGIFNLLIDIITQPLQFVLVALNGFFTTFFKPDPWHIPDFIFGVGQINEGAFDFSTLFYYLYSFVLFYCLFYFIKYCLNIRIYKGISVRFEFLAVIFISLGTIILTSVELRYIIMAVFPFFFIIVSKIRSYPHRVNNDLTFLAYGMIIIFLLLVSVIF